MLVKSAPVVIKLSCHWRHWKLAVMINQWTQLTSMFQHCSEVTCIYACMCTYKSYIETCWVFTNHKYFSCFKHDVPMLLTWCWIIAESAKVVFLLVLAQPEIKIIISYLFLHEHHNISNHQQLNSLFSRLFNLATMETSKLRITGPLWGESTDDWWIPLTKGQ